MIGMSPDNPRAKVLARFVEDLASLSKCEDKKVAAIITSRDGSQIYSIGINGGPKGGEQCLCHMGGRYTCIHAEANAIAKDRSTDKNKVMFTTMGPCPTCAALMVNNGIERLFYLKEWKDDAGLILLQRNDVKSFLMKNYRKEEPNEHTD